MSNNDGATWSLVPFTSANTAVASGIVTVTLVGYTEGNYQFALLASGGTAGAAPWASAVLNVEVVAADPTELSAEFVGSNVKVSWLDPGITASDNDYGDYALWAKVDGGGWVMMGNAISGYGTGATFHSEIGEGTVTFVPGGSRLNTATTKYEFCLTPALTIATNVDSERVSAIIELEVV